MEEQRIKLLVIGESAVGKTCLLLRYTDGTFQENFMHTIGVDFKTKCIEIDGQPIKLQIWDTAGQEKFRAITKAYYRGAHGILVVFDLSKRHTFNQCRMWMDSIIDSSESSPIPFILVGNKCDLKERAVTEEEAREMADSYGIQYYETSAKSIINVDRIFLELTKLTLNALNGKPSHTVKVTGSGTDNTSKENNGCC